MLNKEQIKKLLPHRHEMLLLNKVHTIEPRKSAEGEMILDEDAWFFKGHFPFYPVTPGVLIIEALAQLATVCTSISNQNIDSSKVQVGFLAGINNCKFKKQVKPGSLLVLKTQLRRKYSNYLVYDAQAYLNEELAVTTELRAVVLDIDINDWKF